MVVSKSDTPYRLYRMKQRFLFLFIALLSTVGLAAQSENPVTWKTTATAISDTEGYIEIRATITPPWHLYSQQKVEGPLPTTFRFSPSEFYSTVGAVEESGIPHTALDKGFNVMVTTYSDSVLFRQKIAIKGKGKIPVEGVVEYMVCDDESCMPPTEVTLRTTLGGEADKGDVETAGTLSPVVESDGGQESSDSLWSFFLIAVLAGFAGVLTPCVFPMIPMTVSFFMRGESRQRAVLKGLLFGLSIIVIYTGIGVLVALTRSGADVAGQLSTHWLPNLLFFALFVTFGLSFLGLFEMTLPSGLANSVDRQAGKGGYSAIFFMALTLVIVSFSCTGPIVGAILVESASGLATKPILGMFGFSAAFALPFTLLAIFPSYLRKLPRSGGWMVTVKGVMGLLLLAFSIKFIASVDQAYHLGLLPRELFLSLWIAISVILGCYLLGKIRFVHDDPSDYVSPGRLVMAIFAFAFAIYLLPGLWGAPLQAVSSLIPPAKGWNAAPPTAQISPAQGEGLALCSTPKYADFLQLPHGLQGYFDYKEGLACAKAQNKPALLDFKGHFCSNCKKMEAEVLSDPEILSMLATEFVFVGLYTDDRTTLPESEWVRPAGGGKIKKSMGQINADLQMRLFKTNALPAYVIVAPDGTLLAGPVGYSPDKKAFRDFLEQGLDRFSSPE